MATAMGNDDLDPEAQPREPKTPEARLRLAAYQGPQDTAAGRKWTETCKPKYDRRLREMGARDCWACVWCPLCAQAVQQGDFVACEAALEWEARPGLANAG